MYVLDGMPLRQHIAQSAERIERVNDRTIMVRAGRMLDGTGNPPIDDAAVIVSGGRIQFAGPSGDAPATPGAESWDYPNATLLPGLIDAHMHLTGDTTADVYRRFLTPEARDRPLLAAAHAAAMLAAGFTTVRDLGLPGPGPTVRDAVSNGLIDGPRILSAVAAISQTGGHADWHVFPYDWVTASHYPRGIMADGVDGCLRAVRQVMRDGADVIKLFLESGGVTNTPEDLHAMPEFNDAELRVLIDEPHRRGLRVAAHAKSRDVIKRAVEFGVDTIEHADLSPDDTDIFELMAERGVLLVPTLSLYHWVGSEGERWGIFEGGRLAAAAMLPQRQAMVGAAFAAGVKVATGTDTGSSMALGQNAKELSLLVAAGLSPLEAIEAATRVAAEALGLQESLGTLETGKLADFIVVDGNPCADVSVLHMTRPERVFYTAAGGFGTT